MPEISHEFHALCQKLSLKILEVESCRWQATGLTLCHRWKSGVVWKVEMVVMVAGPRVILLEDIQENQPGAKTSSKWETKLPTSTGSRRISGCHQ